ncbi:MULTISPECIES: DUF3493 domain-containing protein [Prochlorococcus]|uniref:DUF3493 domain-containing protein n=1 Tax=Prochlorococcus TaxID=1218 RepID=UPI00056B3313|nr:MULTISPECIES: DUF3493 domain-containing protein [Prochlorococcus]
MNLDPKVRKKLIRESKNPFYGIRRIIWFSLFASAGIGFLIMIFRLIARENVLIGDLGVQISALILFGALVFFDRRRSK